mgnify:CR=1 FL=1
MTTITVETVEKWHRLEPKLKDKGYERWQWQYSVEDLEGFHAWFGKIDGQRVEIITHSKAVYKAIMEFSEN